MPKNSLQYKDDGIFYNSEKVVIIPDLTGANNSYDPSNTSLNSNTVQAAIDELAAQILPNPASGSVTPLTQATPPTTSTTGVLGNLGKNGTSCNLLQSIVAGGF